MTKKVLSDDVTGQLVASKYSGIVFHNPTCFIAQVPESDVNVAASKKMIFFFNSEKRFFIRFWFGSNASSFHHLPLFKMSLVLKTKKIGIEFGFGRD